jgi:hypothetical protein
MLRCCLRCKPGTDVIPVTVLRAWQVDDGINGPAAKSSFVLLYDLFMGTGRRYYGYRQAIPRTIVCACALMHVCACVCLCCVCFCIERMRYRVNVHKVLARSYLRCVPSAIRRAT